MDQGKWFLFMNIQFNTNYLQFVYIFCLVKLICFFFIQFTNITEAFEELSMMSLPDKVEYILEEVEHISEDPKVDAPPLEPKESIGKEDKKSILKQIRKLKKGLEKVTCIHKIASVF